MLYPILHRLEQRGLIESYWGEAESGRKRRYYRLLPAGSEELQVQRSHWQRFHRIVTDLEKEENGHVPPGP
jgi:DNA-binding PadR family transcriptional regulator